MIEPMKHLRLFLFYTEKKRVLRNLQDLGLVDIDLSEAETQPIRRARHDLAELRKSLAQIEKARAAVAPSSTLPALAVPHECQAQLALVAKLASEKEHLEEALRELASEYEHYLPWGEIPVEGIQSLKAHAVGIHLFSGSVKFFDRYNFAESCVQVVRRTGNTVYFVLITHHDEPPVIPFQKYAIPGRSLSDMTAEMQYLRRRLDETLQKLAALAAGVSRLRHSEAHLENRQVFETAKHSLVSDKTGTVFLITGWIPVSQVSRVLEFLEFHKLAYEIADPGTEDAVPVRLRNSALARLFEPITRIFSLPDYRELDPTPLFAPFFSLFFGFCLGDVGYGLLMLAVAGLLAYRRSTRLVGFLAILLSFTTIGSGILMNSFFGANLFQRDGVGLIAFSHDPAIFAAYTYQGKTVFPAMTLSLLIGFLQIGVAFVLQALNAILLNSWVYAVKPVAMLVISLSAFSLAAHANFLGLGFDAQFAIGPLTIGVWLTAVPVLAAKGGLAAGLLLFFFFGNPQQKIWIRPLAGLWDFYGFATGLLGDFLSYIRLFALALAGGLLGNAFNQIAFMLLPQTPHGPEYLSPWIIATVLVLLIGHALNFGLSVLGAFVHPLRLTFVEFYKNLNFRGGGRAFRAFRRVSA